MCIEELKKKKKKKKKKKEKYNNSYNYFGYNILKFEKLSSNF